MGGPFMVEIVFCRVTRRGRKKKVCPIIDMIMMVRIRWMRTPQIKNICDTIFVMIVCYRPVWTSWLGRTAGTTDQWEEDSSPQILWRYNVHIDNGEKEEEEEGERVVMVMTMMMVMMTMMRTFAINDRTLRRSHLTSPTLAQCSAPWTTWWWRWWRTTRGWEILS